MADGTQTQLTGPAAKVAAFVNQAIARIRREAQTAVDSAVSRAREDIDRIAREAADSALAEARAASAEAQAAKAEMAAMRDEMGATRDEIREMLNELRRRQAEHDEMFASFDDLDGDGVPDALQADMGAAPAAPAPVASSANAEDLETIAQRVFDRLAVEINAGRLSLGDAIGGAVARDDSVHLLTERDFEKFVRVATRGDESSNQLTTRFFYLVAAVHAAMSDDFDTYEKLIGEIEEEEGELRKTVDKCVDERMRERAGATG